MIAFLSIFFLLVARSQVSTVDIYRCTLRRIVANEQENVLRSRINRADIRSQFLPGLSASAGPSANAQGNFGSNANGLSVSVSQKILDFETLSAIDSADTAIRASRLALLQEALDNSILALEDLGQIQTLENQLELFNVQLSNYSLSEQIMSTGSRLGVSDSNDLLQLNSLILFIKTEVNRLNFEIQRRRNVFAARYGYQPVTLTQLQLKGEPSPVDVSRLPAALTIAAQVEQARFDQLVYRRRLWPDLSLQASYVSAQSAWPSMTAYPQRSASIAVVADLSAFWREWNQRQLQEPIIRTRENRLKYNIANQKVEYEQLDQEIGLLLRQAPLVASRLDVTQKSREVSKAKLRLGKLSFLELQQSEQAAYSAAQEKFLLQLRLQLLKLRKELAANFDVKTYNSVACRL
jgi:hypothetical protein